jgi:hypothetical protein
VGGNEERAVRASKMKEDKKGRGLSAKRMNTEGGENGEWRIRVGKEGEVQM